MRAGYVTIIGLPNVGKSTLLNRLLNIKLAITSPRPQTTRNKILGILTEGDCQAVFIDTPGIIKPKYELQKAMVRAIREALADADLVLWLTDMSVKPDEDKIVSQLLSNKKCITAINKIDLVNNKNLFLPVINRYKEIGVHGIFLISALTGEGIEDLKKAVLAMLPQGAFYYPEDQLTEHPERFFIGEIVREKIFERYGEELPYASFVTVEEFKEREKGKYYIRVIIYVEKDSQKGIIIGKKGDALKQLGVNARRAMEDFLDHEVFLDIWVKVRKNWRQRTAPVGDNEG